MDVANSKPVTADQLAGMSADGRLELVRGEVVEMAPTGFEHGAIVAKLTMLMNHHATTRGLGRVVTGDVGFHLAKGARLDAGVGYRLSNVRLHSNRLG